MSPTCSMNSSRFLICPTRTPKRAPPAEPLQVPEQPEAIPVGDSPKVEPPRKRTDEDNYRVYLLKNLSSAHTAACIEEKLRKLTGISDAVVVYATQQPRFRPMTRTRLDQIRRICMSIDPSVELVPLSHAPRNRQEFHKPGQMRGLIAGVAFLILGALAKFSCRRSR